MHDTLRRDSQAGIAMTMTPTRQAAKAQCTNLSRSECLLNPARPCSSTHVGGLPGQVQLPALGAVVDGVVVREDEAVQTLAVGHVARVI